ncbi:MAG TPA: Gfo/Idh/MocA family oxidoreductase [Micromonosporaceae bacterium]
MTDLRIGLIGAGDISQYHLAAWSRVPDARVVAVCDRDLDRARQRADQFGIDAVFADAGSMFAASELDAVDIATWRETHAELVLLAAEHGVHVLCQKPLAPTLAEAVELTDAVAGRIRLMVHENRRFAPHFRQVRKWLVEGRVGPVRQSVMTTYRSSLRKGPDGVRLSVARAAYFGRERRLMIGEALIHHLDVLRFLLGPLRVVAARTLHTEPDLPGETVATILLETVPDGAPVVLAGSYVAPGFGGTNTSASLGAQTSDRLELSGELSSITMTDDRLALRGAYAEDAPVDYAATYQRCFDEAIAHFVRQLRSGEPFETSPEDNLQTLALVEDSYRLALDRCDESGVYVK